MRIKEIIARHRRDFTAIYVCGYCGFECKGGGYDDNNFHRNVIPEMKCGGCNKKGDPDYHPMDTRYPEGLQL